MKRLGGGALAAVIALGCQGTSGGVLPDARTGDAAVDPCAEPTDWATRTPRPIAPYELGPVAIALDEAQVYWTEPLICGLDGGCAPGPILLSAPLAGGDAEILFESEEDLPASLAVTRDHLFLSADEQLWRMGKDGSAPEVVGAGAQVVSDSEAIYFWRGGALVRLDADTLQPSTVSEADGRDTGLQLVGGWVFWLEPDPVEIWRLPLTGGAAERTVRIEDTRAGSLAVASDERAFLVTSNAGDPGAPSILVRVALAGGAPEPVAELEGGIYQVVVDDTHVYWLEANRHRLSRMPLDGGCVESRDYDAQASMAMAPSADGILVASAGNIAVIAR